MAKVRAFKKGSRFINRDRVVKSMGFVSYRAYLASALWSEIRGRILARDHGKCRLCGEPANSVHHVTYTKPVMCGRNDGQLISICRGCHESIEFDGGKKLLKTAHIAEMASKRAIKKLGGRRSKSLRKKMRPECACCGEKYRRLGRNDVCMPCYKSGRAIGFARANPQVAPNFITPKVPDSQTGTTT